MPATPQPMDIYHPAAAIPRPVETVQARSSYVPPAVSEDAIARAMREQAEAECRRPQMPKVNVGTGINIGPNPQPTSLASRVRAALADGAAKVEVIAQRMGEDRVRTNDALQSQRRSGMADACALTGVWQLTEKGRQTMARAKAPAPKAPKPKMESCAALVRAHLAAHGASCVEQIAEGTGLPKKLVTRSLSRQKSAGTVEQAGSRGAWRLAASAGAST